MSVQMIYSKTCILIFSLISIGCFAANAGNTIKVYKWVDQNGITHFDQTPPLATQKEIIKLTKTASSAATTAAPTSTTPPATQAAKTDKPTQASAPIKDKENCEIAKKNADILKSFARIKVADEKGEQRYLSEEEKQQRIDESDKMIQDNCE